MLAEGVGESVDVVSAARKWQGGRAYPGVDEWSSVRIEKGSYVWGGAPGQSNFYTTDEMIKATGIDATKIFEGLQVDKGNFIQYRPGMTQYEITREYTAEYSKSLANPQYGKGGFDQYFISNYEDVLNPVKSNILTNRGGMK